MGTPRIETKFVPIWGLTDTSPPLSNDDIKHVQRIIGRILYYAQAVDLTILMALITIVSKQSKGRSFLYRGTYIWHQVC